MHLKIKDEIYYVNYCTEEDFKEIKKLGMSLTGKIVLCRYGKTFRGNIVNIIDVVIKYLELLVRISQCFIDVFKRKFCLIFQKKI